MGKDRMLEKRLLSDWDVAALLRLMEQAWNSVFLVIELRDHRNN